MSENNSSNYEEDNFSSVPSNQISFDFNNLAMADIQPDQIKNISDEQILNMQNKVLTKFQELRMCYDAKIIQSQVENTKLKLEHKTAQKIAEELKSTIG